MSSYLLWHGIDRQARPHPDRLAVSDGATELTYGGLLEKADAVAGLLQRAGLEPGDRVGVLARKSTACVVAMLGASRAGGCYVPVDPRAPAARSRYILANARVRFLISEGRLLESLGFAADVDGIPAPGRILLLDEDDGIEGALRWSELTSAPAPTRPAQTELDPAYILYTSGSTGSPKGVVISHRNALTFVDWARDTFALGPEDRLSNHAPFHFDLSVLDIYGALTSGASVHLVPDRLAPFPGELARWIEESGITVWYSVPSALVRLLLHGNLERFGFHRLRTILFAGEVFPIKHLRAVMDAFAASEFHNLYGPTETNVCTYYSVPRPLPPEVTDLPIGASCADIESFAVTDEGARCAPGEEGELLVRGPCVMMGYWGLPERTAKSITQNPLHSDFIDPVYKTGDRVRLLDDGGFQFLGRRDHMVKVRGYRVELGEIETALHALAGVREAAVVAVEDDEVGARLHAAIVATEGVDLDEGDVRKHCVDNLLRYAVPETFTWLDALPRTSTGKADRMALKALLTSPQHT